MFEHTEKTVTSVHRLAWQDRDLVDRLRILITDCVLKRNLSSAQKNDHLTDQKSVIFVFWAGGYLEFKSASFMTLLFRAFNPIEIHSLDVRLRISLGRTD
jgi:hypothetical protein